MQRVAKLARMEFRTTEPYSPWQNKAKSVIKIIKGKSKRIKVQRNISKRFWDFGLVLESDIYSWTAGKDGRPYLEQLTGDSIDISKFLEFYFCDLVWFCNNHSYDTNPMLGRWLGVSHSVGSALYYWILSEKRKFLSRTTVQNLTSEEPRDYDFQEWIRDYHGYLEDSLGSKDFCTSLYGYD